MSMTDPGCQRITHLQYLLRGSSLFSEEGRHFSANARPVRLVAGLVGI
jgi:hypothetical protein